MPHSDAAESLLRSYIKAIPGQKAEARHDWFTQGLMFARLSDDWAEVPGRDDIRLELWEALSRKCKGFEDATGCAEKWEDILHSAARQHEKPATFRSLQHMAKEAGWTWENSGIDPALIEGAKAALAAARGRVSAEEAFDIEDDSRGEQAALAPPAAVAATSAFKMSFEDQDFVTLPTPREWLYGRHYIRKFVSVTVAPGGVGKSSLDLGEGVAMASGRDLLKNGFHKRWKVAVWNGEDPKDELRRRVLAVMRHFGIAPEEIEERLALASGRETPLCLMKQIDGAVIASPHVEQVKAFLKTNKVDVFTVDPFVKSHGVPENVNEAINAVATQWAAIAEECNCAIELVHHVRKPAAGSTNETSVNDGRGAGALVDASRSARVLNVMTPAEAKAMRVRPEDRRRYFRVDNGKANMQPPSAAADWHFLESQPLGNATNEYQEDFVGVVTAWKPPAVESIFGILARELASGRFGSGAAKVADVVKSLGEDEQGMFGDSSNLSRSIKAKLEKIGWDNQPRPNTEHSSSSSRKDLPLAS